MPAGPPLSARLTAAVRRWARALRIRPLLPALLVAGLVTGIVAAGVLAAPLLSGPPTQEGIVIADEVTANEAPTSAAQRDRLESGTVVMGRDGRPEDELPADDDAPAPSGSPPAAPGTSGRAAPPPAAYTSGSTAPDSTTSSRSPSNRTPSGSTTSSTPEPAATPPTSEPRPSSAEPSTAEPSTAGPSSRGPSARASTTAEPSTARDTTPPPSRSAGSPSAPSSPVPSPSEPSSPARGSSPAPGPGEQLRSALTAARAAAGCGELATDAGLEAAARTHSRAMREAGSPGLTAGDSDLSDRQAVVARGGSDPDRVLDAWLAGPEAGTLLDCARTVVGVGRAGGPGGPWWTVVLA